MACVTRLARVVSCFASAIHSAYSRRQLGLSALNCSPTALSAASASASGCGIAASGFGSPGLRGPCFGPFAAVDLLCREEDAFAQFGGFGQVCEAGQLVQAAHAVLSGFGALAPEIEGAILFEGREMREDNALVEEERPAPFDLLDDLRQRVVEELAEVFADGLCKRRGTGDVGVDARIEAGGGWCLGGLGGGLGGGHGRIIKLAG